MENKSKPESYQKEMTAFYQQIPTEIQFEKSTYDTLAKELCLPIEELE
jgi:hypothetical protein